MSVDPKVVPSAVPLGELSYDEAAELSYFGAHILHPRTVEPAKAASLEVRVKNVFHPERPGSRIRPSGVEGANSVKSISSMKAMTIIKAYGAGAGYSEGVLAEISAALRDVDVNIYSAATSQTCISLLIKRTDMSKALEVLESSRKGVINNIEAEGEVALVCIVGEGLGYRKGIAARVFTAVARSDVNVAMISAGASTVAYQFVVDQNDLGKTILAIHDEFFGGR
jgi:aspartokinase/homoserine dehydrogenase 1